MKNTKYWIIAVIACALVIFWFSVDTSDNETNMNNDIHAPSADTKREPASPGEKSTPASGQQKSPQSPNEQQENTDELKAYAHIAERLETMQSRRPDRHFDPAAVDAAVKRDTAWAPAEETPSDLPLKPEELTDGRQFIQFDSLKIETLMPGDNIKIYIDDTGEEYVVQMDRVEKHDYQSISWYGHIDGSDGQPYNVSFTRGESLTVGGLDTPEGHYVLQAHGDNGWIASSGLLFKVDPDVPDVMYPHDETGHEHAE